MEVFIEKIFPLKLYSNDTNDEAFPASCYGEYGRTLTDK